MKPLGPDEGMNALRHPDCRFCDEYERLMRGPTEEVRQLKAKLAKLEDATSTQLSVSPDPPASDRELDEPDEHGVTPVDEAVAEDMAARDTGEEPGREGGEDRG